MPDGGSAEDYTSTGIAFGHFGEGSSPNRLDLAISFYQNSAPSNTGVDLFQNLGGGDLANAATSFVPFSEISAGLASADLNGDGLSDLIILGSTSGQTRVRLGTQSAGTFLPETTLALPTGVANPDGVTVGDLNGDGVPDILPQFGSVVFVQLSSLSLRQAIILSNINPGPDTIDFKIAGTGVQTITPASALPVITDQVVIDGFSQPGYAGSPLIEINGASTDCPADGLTIYAGGSTVQGLAINRFSGNGIVLARNGGNTIQNNVIGLDPTGTVARGNLASGVLIKAVPNNTIRDNVLSSNGEGVTVTSDGSTPPLSDVLTGPVFGDYSGTLTGSSTSSGRSPVISSSAGRSRVRTSCSHSTRPPAPPAPPSIT